MSYCSQGTATPGEMQFFLHCLQPLHLSVYSWPPEALLRRLVSSRPLLCRRTTSHL